MKGFNDAGTDQEPLDEGAFTEAGVALSRMGLCPLCGTGVGQRTLVCEDCGRPSHPQVGGSDG